MAPLRLTWRMANWWGVAAMFAVAAFFGWVIREGLGSTSGNVWIRTLIPPYVIFLYVTVATLVNRRTVVATDAGVLMTSGPIPLGGGRRWIPRDDIEFTSYVPVVTAGESSETVVLWYLTGIGSRAGVHQPVFGMFHDSEAAVAAARNLAIALGPASDGSRVDARPHRDQPEVPGERSRIFIWTGLIIAATAAGFVWEVVHRRAAGG